MSEQRIIVTGTPIDGFTYIGPFDSFESAESYADHIGVMGDWWITDLQSPGTPETPGQQALPLHYPGAAVPIPPADWEPTHYSRKDGSGAVMVIGNKFNRTITLVNENGDQWTDPIDEWEPA